MGSCFWSFTSSDNSNSLFYYLAKITGYRCDSFSSGKKCFVPSISSHWERLILPFSLWERSLLSSSPLRERITLPFFLYKRGETSRAFMPVFFSSFMERVMISSALVLTLVEFYDNVMVLGLKKVDFSSTSLQISTYGSLGDWLLIVYDLAVDGVLFTALDNGFRFLNVFMDSRNFAPLIISKEFVLCCVVPLNLSCLFPFHVVVLMWLWLLYFHIVNDIICTKKKDVSM